MSSKVKALLLGLAAIILAAVAGACDPGASITFENRRPTRLTFYIEPGANAKPQFELEPFETTTVGFLQFHWKDRLIARDPSGNVVLDKRITYDELKKMEREGKHIVIEPPK